MHSMTSASLIASLNLQEHPEGGYFRETYRSQDVMCGSDHVLYTSILYLLDQVRCQSRLHRLKSDEMWLMHHGSLELFVFADGKMEKVRMGVKVDEGEVLQYVVKKGEWFGARVVSEWALAGCVVCPGFEFEDFEVGMPDISAYDAEAQQMMHELNGGKKQQQNME